MEKIKEYLRIIGKPEYEQEIVKALGKSFGSVEDSKAKVKFSRFACKNVLVVKTVDIDFERGGIIEIIGRNASGKTTLMRSILYLLNGGDNFSRFLNKESQLRLEFEIGEDGYKIVNNGKNIYLMSGDDIKATGHKNIKNVLIKKIPEIEGIKDVLYIGDPESYITRLEPRHFKEYFMRVFGLDEISRAYERAKDEYKIKEREYNQIVGQRDYVSATILNDFDIMTKKRRIKELRTRLAEIDKEREAVDVEIDGGSVLMEKINRINQLKEEHRRKADELERYEHIVFNERVFREYDERKREIDKKEDEYRKAEKERNEIEKEIMKLEAQVDFEKKNLELFAGSGNRCQVCESEITVLRKQIIEKQKSERIKEFEKQIEEKKEALTRLNNELVKLKESINDEIASLERIERIKLELFNFGIRSEEDIKKIKRINIEDKKIEISELLMKIKGLEMEVEEIREVNKDKEKKRAQIKRMMDERDKISREIGELEKEIKISEENKCKLNEIEDELKKVGEKMEIKKEIVDILNRANSKSFPVWYMKSLIDEIVDNVNKDIDKIKVFDMSIDIDDNFQVKISKGRKPRVLSASEEKVLNLLIKLNVAKYIYKNRPVPVFFIDETVSGFDEITKERIFEYLKNQQKYIDVILLTLPEEKDLGIVYLGK